MYVFIKMSFEGDSDKYLPQDVQNVHPSAPSAPPPMQVNGTTDQPMYQSYPTIPTIVPAQDKQESVPTQTLPYGQTVQPITYKYGDNSTPQTFQNNGVPIVPQAPPGYGQSVQQQPYNYNQTVQQSLQPPYNYGDQPVQQPSQQPSQPPYNYEDQPVQQSSNNTGEYNQSVYQYDQSSYQYNPSSYKYNQESYYHANDANNQQYPPNNTNGYQPNQPPPYHNINHEDDQFEKYEPAPMLVTDDDRVKYREMCSKIESFMVKYSVDKAYRDFIDLIPLNEFTIICEDSGSMVGDKWKELENDVSIYAELLDIFDESKLSLLFLNRCTDIITDVTGENVSEKFMGDPIGFATIDEVLKVALSSPSVKPKVVILMMNSLPMTCTGRINTTEIDTILNTADYKNSKIVIMCRTADDRVQEYATKLRTFGDHISVLYNYSREVIEVKNTQGYGFPYSRGDHLIRSLLNSSEHYFCNMGTKKINVTINAQGNINMEYTRDKDHPNYKKKDSNCVIS